MQASQKTGPLSGLNVLVTRPAHQAQPLIQCLQTEGADTVLLPVIEMSPAPLTAQLTDAIEQIQDYDIALFISANAVTHTIPLLPPPSWPAHIKIAGVGQQTTQQLINHGFEVDIEPRPPFNSESLLNTPELSKVSGKKIIIFRGVGGREKLANTLTERGADVAYAEVYQRKIPRFDDKNIEKIVKTGNIDIITITSNEGLQNLYQIVGGAHRQWLLEKPIAVLSERCASLAMKLGFTHKPTIAKIASNDGLVKAIEDWYAAKSP
ncbi:MAG: uroporphyrinogen-III synthase [Gammaproteobacteria bacterium]